MASLEISLLGEPEIVYDGKPWVMRAPRITWSLVALLVTHPRPLERAPLGCLLWPDREESVARSTLRRYLHRLGNALPPGDWIVGDAKTVGWNHDAPCRIDAIEFERALAVGRNADAVALYAGDLLGVAFDEAILDERERLRGAYLDALENLAAEARAERRFGDAVRFAEQLLAADEWREDALRALMTARYHDGDRSGALVAYDRFARALHQELHVPPMAETTALRDAILSGSVVIDEPPVQAQAGVPFVGRTGEMRALQHAWVRAARGNGSAVFCSGEAGIGKSRLASELCSLVEAQGGRALLGRTSSPESGAFEAIIEALRAGLSLVAADDLDDVWWAALAPVIPEVAAIRTGAGDAATLESEPGRLRQREAFARLMAAMAARKPLAIVLEDVHWAEQETIELFETLVRRAGALSILFVVTMRPEEVDARHPLESARRRLQRERRAQTVALGPLSGDEVLELAATLLEAQPAAGDAGARISNAANGHPLFALQLLRHYRDTGELPADGAGFGTVGDAVMRRVERLPGDARQIAEIAATIEGAFTVEELARISGWEESRVFDAVGALLDAKLVSERGGERFAYGFAHALIEVAVRASLAGADLRPRHRRVAAVLEETRAGDGAAFATIAAHWEAAGDAPHAASARLRAAEASMARYARREARAHARRALELGLNDADRFAALFIVASATADLGEYDAEMPELRAIEELANAMGDQFRYDTFGLRLRAAKFAPERHHEITAQFVEFVAGTGRADWIAEGSFAQVWTLGYENYDRAETALRSVVAVARTQNNLDLAFRALSPLVQIGFRLGHAEEALADLTAVEHEFERDGDRRALLPLSQGYLEYAFSTDFADAAAVEKAREYSTRLAEVGGDVQTHLSARDVLAYGGHVVWDVSAARAEHLECARIAQELGLDQNRAIASANLAELELDLGHLERALALLREAAAIATRMGFRAFLSSATVGLAEANLALGRTAAALRDATRALELAREIEEPRFESQALVVLGAAQAATANVEAGLASMRSGIELSRGLSSDRAIAHELTTYLSALLDAGHGDEAQSIASELEELFVANPQRQRSPGRIALALVRAAESRGDRARAFRLRHLGKTAVEAVLAKMSEPEDRAVFAALPFNRALLEPAG